MKTYLPYLVSACLLLAFACKKDKQPEKQPEYPHCSLKVDNVKKAYNLPDAQMLLSHGNPLSIYYGDPVSKELVEIHLTGRMEQKTYGLPAQQSKVELIYNQDARKAYIMTNGSLDLISADSSLDYYKGKFEGIFKDPNNSNDSVKITEGEFLFKVF